MEIEPLQKALTWEGDYVTDLQAQGAHGLALEPLAAVYAAARAHLACLQAPTEGRCETHASKRVGLEPFCEWVDAKWADVDVIEPCVFIEVRIVGVDTK